MVYDFAQLAYVNTNWLETSDTPSVGAASLTVADTANGINNWYTTYYPWGYHSETKIRLALSEVEKLRTAAKNDAKLKKILQKFAPHIEIVVDFE